MVGQSLDSDSTCGALYHQSVKTDRHRHSGEREREVGPRLPSQKDSKLKTLGKKEKMIQWCPFPSCDHCSPFAFTLLKSIVDC